MCSQLEIFVFFVRRKPTLPISSKHQSSGFKCPAEHDTVPRLEELCGTTTGSGLKQTSENYHLVPNCQQDKNRNPFGKDYGAHCPRQSACIQRCLILVFSNEKDDLHDLKKLNLPEATKEILE